MSGKRRTKENSLSLRWSEKEKGILYQYPTSPTDGHLLHYIFDVPRKRSDGTYDEPVWKQLEERGYDITTAIFSIRKKENIGPK